MQRAIWIVTFLIMLACGYYWFVIHEADINEMRAIADRNELQSDSINVVTENERRLELKYAGHGKHLQTIQNEFKAHFKNYVEKMDSIDYVFETIDVKFEDIEDRLTRKINNVEDIVRNLEDEFSSFKRRSNLDINNLRQELKTRKEDIDAIKQDILKIRKDAKLDDD